MDDDHGELLSLLCTRIGTIMEDASVIALTLGSQEPEVRQVQFEEVKRASASIAALAAAAEALI